MIKIESKENETKKEKKEKKTITARTTTYIH